MTNDFDQDADLEIGLDGYVASEGRNHLTGYEEHLQDSQGYPDVRVCSQHPDVKIGSPCGNFDACCWKCEQACDDAYEADYRKGQL